MVKNDRHRIDVLWLLDRNILFINLLAVERAFSNDLRHSKNPVCGKERNDVSLHLAGEAGLCYQHYSVWLLAHMHHFEKLTSGERQWVFNLVGAILAYEPNFLSRASV